MLSIHCHFNCHFFTDLFCQLFIKVVFATKALEAQLWTFIFHGISFVLDVALGHIKSILCFGLEIRQVTSVLFNELSLQYGTPPHMPYYLKISLVVCCPLWSSELFT